MRFSQPGRRAQLPAMFEHFREAGPDAEQVVIGTRRRPEAVVLSYERYLKLAGGADPVNAFLDRQLAKIGSGLGDDDAMELANRELRALRRERRGS